MKAALQMMSRLSLWICLIAVAAPAQTPRYPPGYNLDEAKVPPYTLVDPLRDAKGHEVSSRAEWVALQPEILSEFEKNVFGKTPDAARRFRPQFRVVEQDTPALDGLGVRRQVTITLTPKKEQGPVMHLLLYLPAKHHGPAPVVLGLNFTGNASVDPDPGILATAVWEGSKVKGEPPHEVAFPQDRRGQRASEWQVEMLLRRGYGLATAYYGDIDPDFKNAESLGVSGYYTPPNGSAKQQMSEPGWGAISAWAWGLSRALDYLGTDPAIDRNEIAVMGHSRLGKTADWAAAQDKRFAVVLSNESGKGGQSLFHREFGENIAHLEQSFPYWFCPEFARWVGHDRDIPVDGNLLLALIAPRPLYVASAQEDLWSDPRGEFLSAADVGRVYALFGEQGLGTDQMPAVNEPIMHDVAYHVRTGVHDVTAFDWEQYLNFMDLRFGSPLDRADGVQGAKHGSRTHE